MIIDAKTPFASDVKASKKISLLSRPLDLFYFVFFCLHIPITLSLDAQILYPRSWMPDTFVEFGVQAIKMSADPLMAGIWGLLGEARKEELLWFKTFLTVELFFQVPVFTLGACALWQGSRAIYPVLLFYGASTATTTLPCLVTLLATPVSSTPYVWPTEGKVAVPFSVTPEQRVQLICFYVPFFLVPLGLAIDMSLRVTKLIQKGVQAEERWKKD